MGCMFSAIGLDCGRQDGEGDDGLGMIKHENRKFRDLPCCIVFSLFWVGMIIIGAISLATGEPRRLVYGTDYEGHVCGVDAGFEDAKYTAYPRINEDIKANEGKDISDMTFYGVCVEECNEARATVTCDNSMTGLTWANAAIQDEVLEKCFNGMSVNTTYSTSVGGKTLKCSSTTTSESIVDHCWPVPYNTSAILFRCVPKYTVDNTVSKTCTFPSQGPDGQPLDADDDRCLLVSEERDGSIERPAKTNALFDKLNDASQSWGRYMGDLSRTWWVIVLMGVVMAILGGMLYLLFIRMCTGVVVWGTVLAVLVVSISLTSYCYYKAGLITNTALSGLADKVNGAFAEDGTAEVSSGESLNDEEDNRIGYRYAAYVMTFITIIALVTIVALRKSISVAVDVLKLGAHAVHDLGVELLTFPLVTTTLLFGVAMWFLFVSAYLMSAATLEEQDSETFANTNAFGNSSISYQVSDYAPNVSLRYMFLYHFFGFLWTANWISGLSFITIATAVGGWYFARPVPAESKAPVHKQPESYVVYTAFWETLKHYLGTAAMGSFLIAFVQFVRAIVLYIDRKTKEAQGNNCLLRMVFKCVHCLLWCLECILKVITRNAYVFVAVKGYGFCGAGAKAITTIAANMKTLAVVNALGEMLLWMGKVIVASICGFLTIMVVENASTFQEGENAVFSSWLPGIVTFMVAFLVADMIMQLWDASVDSMLVCYIVDITENKRPVHAGDNDPIASINSKHSQEDAEETANPLPNSTGSATQVKEFK